MQEINYCDFLILLNIDPIPAMVWDFCLLVVLRQIKRDLFGRMPDFLYLRAPEGHCAFDYNKLINI